MKWGIYLPFSNELSNSVLTSPIHYIFLQYSIQNFLYNDGFTNINIIKDKVNTIASYGKKTALSIMWGSSCGTNFYNQYPYIGLTEKAHEGQQGNPAVFNKFPVFYDAAYLAKVDSFLQWLSVGLQPVIQYIDHIKIGGINQTTFEKRAANQDFATTNDVNEAYRLGALKWISMGYTTTLARFACREVISYHQTHFPSTTKIAAVIGGLNGWPCISDGGSPCEPKSRPNITNDVINYCREFNSGVQVTALTDVSGTPANVANSGLPVYYQLNFQKFNKSVSKDLFEAAILNGLRHHGVAIEVYKKNIEQHSDIITKYSSI